MDTFNFLLNPLFFRYSTEISKTSFSKLESSSRFWIEIINGAQNFKFTGFWYANLIGWILYKIRLVSRLKKREDQALISISTILKFPVLFTVPNLEMHKMSLQDKILDNKPCYCFYGPEICSLVSSLQHFCRQQTSGINSDWAHCVLLHGPLCTFA